MTNLVVIVNSLGKCYPIDGSAKKKLGGGLRCVADLLRHGFPAKKPDSVHWALKDVSFTVNRGDRIGIIGRNGAGKSTLLKILSRVSYPTTGEARIRGSLTSLLEVGTGFNDNLSGRENIFLNASLYGMTRADIANKFDDIVTFSEVGRFIDTPVKHYSSGMRMRLAFSVAAHLEPDILLLDEVLAVGDMSFQRKCLERVDALTSNGQTLFFVSHSMDSIIRYCTRCIWLEGGKIKADGEARAVVSAYVEEVLKVKSQAVFTGGISPGISAEQQHAVLAPTTTSTAASSSPTARLLTANVISPSGEKKTLFTVSEQVGVAMEYEVSGMGIFLPAIHVYCPQGVLLFAATPPDADLDKFRSVGGKVRCATAWLPKHFLNIGTYSVSVVVFNPLEAPFTRYFYHHQLLSFHCVEVPAGEKSAKGMMPRPFPGPIRPLLEWSLRDDVTLRK